MYPFHFILNYEKSKQNLNYLKIRKKKWQGMVKFENIASYELSIELVVPEKVLFQDNII